MLQGIWNDRLNLSERNALLKKFKLEDQTVDDVIKG